MSMFPTPRCFGSLLERMEKLGFDEAFVRKGILPDWWSEDCDRDLSLLPDFEFMVARFLKMPLSEVQNPSIPLRLPDLSASSNADTVIP